MTATKDATADYWGYLIGPDKSPAPLFEQLLLGVANYVIKHIAPWKLQCLTPDKLAAFYRLVGGNYDPLFLETPHATLSYIYQCLGCFHSLQPTTDPFAPPSVPALTPHGFVRWQTIQLLLGPDEHVPFLQRALKRFDIVNPGAEDVFPKALPREAFPLEPDEAMVKWHEGVCEMLQQEAETEQARIAPEAHVSNHTSDHSRESSVQGRVAVDDAPDYFSSTHRGNREGNVEFAHVSFQPHQPRRRSAQDDHEDRRSHHARPRSSTEHPYKRDPYWFSHRSKPRPRSHRREYRDRRARSPSNTSVSSDSDTTDEERVSPRDTSNPGTSRHHDPERLFPPSTYRDRRHSHHSLNKPRGEDPPQSPRYVPHRHPSYPQPPRPQPVPPPGNGRGIDPRWRELDSRGSYPGSAPSTPGPYPGRAPTRFVDSGRESNEERPLVRRFVAPLRGVGGRRYPPDPTRGR